jgi:hypothetical protein
MTRQTIYPIRTLSGDLVAEHVRIDRPDGSKTMFWMRDGHKGLGGMSTAALPLYGTETLAGAPTGATVLVHEGERATDAGRRLGYHAVGTVTGASGCPGEDALGVLLQYDVVLWPDNDVPGWGHMARVAAGLIRLGGSCRLLTWGERKGDDASDFEALGALPWLLAKWVRDAPDYRPTVEEARTVVRVVRERRDDGDRVERARSSLLDVVEARLGPPDRTDGRSAWWRCPFHRDGTPSFKVDLREPFWICFGCEGKKGDAFDFLREMDGVPFKDALRELAPETATRLLGTAGLVG